MPIEKSACLGAAEEAFRLAATTPLGPLAAHFRLFLIDRGEVTLPPPPAPTAPQPGLSSVVAALSPAAPPPRRAPHPPPLHLNIRCMDCRSVRASEAHWRAPGLSVRAVEVPIRSPAPQPPKDDPDYDLLVRQDTPSRALFRSPPREILLCHNSLRNDAEVAETLVHEMTHAVDVRARAHGLGRVAGWVGERSGGRV
jgi:hypothetical protein